jgi:hypothetical protein
MSIAYVAVIAGIAVTLVYIAMVYLGFRKSKVEMAAHGGAQLGEVSLVGDEIFDEQVGGLFWKGAAGLVLSVIALWLISVSASVWYLVPFLGLGTSLAVITAFLIDKDN